MDYSFFAYIQKMELIGFFSGYPLIYAAIYFFTGRKPIKNIFINKISLFLPTGYALVGTLYLGLQLKNLYPDYSIETISQAFYQPILICYALLSLLFWIPAIAIKTILSLLHSIVFFYFILKDLFVQIFAISADWNILSNDFKLYNDSMLLNLGAFAIIVLINYLLFRFKKNKS